MEPYQPLRILIVGQPDNFHHVLSANIQHWGYSVLCCSSDTLWQEETQNTLAKWQADVLLYNLDDVIDVSRFHTSADMLSTYKDRKQFLIVLSSCSISRRALEDIGAVALLQKPFEMGRLSRYLSVLQQLLYPSVARMCSDRDRNYKRIRILIADDDANIVAIIRQCLTADVESVFDVAVAYDGLDALEQCLCWQPHCIVTDLIMPLMNGYQVMRCLALGAAHITPAFVIMSALTPVEASIDASYLAGQTVAYVNKPFHIEQLLAAIRQVCLVNQSSTKALC